MQTESVSNRLVATRGGSVNSPHDAEKCRPVIGNVMVYRHLAHITATYVRSLEPVLARELTRAIESPGALILNASSPPRDRLTTKPDS